MCVSCQSIATAVLAPTERTLGVHWVQFPGQVRKNVGNAKPLHTEVYRTPISQPPELYHGHYTD
jgi:hypothetical protein